MIPLFHNNLLFSQGLPLLSVVVFCGVLALFWSKRFFMVVVGIFFFCLYFFRNPVRVCVPAFNDTTVLVCPADGKVVALTTSDTEFEGLTQRVSIVLSVFDVHVNWLPIDGTVHDVVYRPGTFMFAFLPKSSVYNERNDIIIQATRGERVVVRQIAGAIARRICCWIKPGDNAVRGTTYGMIRFGSRVEIVLPPSVMLSVGVGQPDEEIDEAIDRLVAALEAEG